MEKNLANKEKVEGPGSKVDRQGLYSCLVRNGLEEDS